MQADQIQQIAAWLAATDIGRLELRGPGQHLVLRHERGAVDVVHGDGTAPLDANAAPAAAAAAPYALTVVAPSVGVFLHRHPLRTDTLAVPGSAVRSGQTIGLLQVGLLLLPLPAPADATMHEWLVAHGTTVGYGTPLVVLRDAADA